MTRQNSAQEHEVIELQQHNVEESEPDNGMPLKDETRQVGISLAHLILPVGEILHSRRNDTWRNIL